MPVVSRALSQNEPLPAYSDYYLRRFKSHDKTAKRDTTAVEAVERNVSELVKWGKLTKTMKVKKSDEFAEAPAAAENNIMEEIMSEARPDIEIL
jgi:hypothetical protein